MRGRIAIAAACVTALGCAAAAVSLRADAQTEGTPVVPADVVHVVVQQGDTSAAAVARRLCGADVAPSMGSSIARMNGDNKTWLIGEVLHVPARCPEPSTTTTTATTSTTSTTSTAAPTTTSVTSTSTTTSTVAPSTAPPTTAPPATTTTQPTTTSTTPSSSSTTSTTPSPTTTTPPPGVAFFEDFSTPGAFLQRFDYNVVGIDSRIPQWSGDHDTIACGDPALTSRTIHEAAGRAETHYQCAPGGDNAKAHLMTSVNTEGYAIAWFSPKPTFTDVTKVCWSQNFTKLGGGKWTQVLFLQPDEYQGQTDLGYTSPEFPNTGGPSTDQGSARNGVKLDGEMAIWNLPDGSDANAFESRWNQFTPNPPPSVQHKFNWGAGFSAGSDKATRFRNCITDLGNGQARYTLSRPDGSTIGTWTQTGGIPDGQIRIVFEDDNYDPPKRDGYSAANLSWHWDEILVDTAG